MQVCILGSNANDTRYDYALLQVCQIQSKITSQSLWQDYIYKQTNICGYLIENHGWTYAWLNRPLIAVKCCKGALPWEIAHFDFLAKYSQHKNSETSHMPKFPSMAIASAARSAAPMCDKQFRRGFCVHVRDLHVQYLFPWHTGS